MNRRGARAYAVRVLPAIDKMELSDKKQIVDELLKKGVWFSIFWLMGFGSFVAVKNGWKARKIINESNGEINSDGRVWWCFIVGGAGLSFWLFVLIMAFINNSR
jgi:hypothetical protein